MKRYLLTILLLASVLVPTVGKAQQFTGISGLVHVPSAEMHQEGDARFGTHFMDKSMLPDTGFLYRGDKYNTYDYYLGLTPFSWLEISYVCTKRMDMVDGKPEYNRKDRNASFKIRPIKEGKYWPAVAVGCNDAGSSVAARITGSNTSVQLYFQNYYIAATKHFEFSGNELGVDIAYRHYYRGYNAKWNGLVGGVTFRPAFFPQGRAMLEYTGNEFVLGVDALLFKHLFLQASLMDFQHLSLGFGFQMNLFGNNHR